MKERLDIGFKFSLFKTFDIWGFIYLKGSELKIAL